MLSSLELFVQTNWFKTNGFGRAILQMDLLGHDFFIYVDVEDQTTNVIYRREDGEIGLLEVKES